MPALNQHQVSPSMNKTLPATTESPVHFLLSLFPKDAGQQDQFPQPSTVDPDDYEPWDMESFQAISRNDVSKLRELLEVGKCFDACNLNGETLLHLACRRGDLKTVKFMLEEACVQHDVCDDMGRTILHDVCWRPAPNLEIMATLISTLSPYTLIAKDRRGHTPFDYVRREHWGVWLSFLQENQCLIERRVTIASSFQ
jgi:ankyrin repeat protein